ENSEGQWAAGAHSSRTDSSVVKTSNGDVYAGHDGNIYKKSSDGTWQKYVGSGNWEDTSWKKPAPGTQATNSTAAESNWRSQMQNRPMANNWRNWANNQQSGEWRNNLENRWQNPGGENAWNQHNVQQGLNQDSWARSWGNANTESSLQSREGA